MPAHTPTALTLTQEADGCHRKDEDAHTEGAHGTAEQANQDRLSRGCWRIDMYLDGSGLVVDPNDLHDITRPVLTAAVGGLEEERTSFRSVQGPPADVVGVRYLLEARATSVVLLDRHNLRRLSRATVDRHSVDDGLASHARTEDQSRTQTQQHCGSHISTQATTSPYARTGCRS